MIEQIHDEEEYKRNRKRVMEINKLIDYFRDDIYEANDLQDQDLKIKIIFEFLQKKKRLRFVFFY